MPRHFNLRAPLAALVASLLASSALAAQRPPAKGPPTKGPATKAPAAKAPAAAAPAPAPPPPPAGRVGGVLFDSLHMAPLADAVIRIEGSTRSAASDADGRFVVDSIPPGHHMLTVTHPLLDSVYFQVVAPVRVAADSMVMLTMAIPSFATLFGGDCPPATARLGPAVFAGRVLDAETKEPVTGVRVALVWQQISVGTDIGLRRMPRVRTANTDARGYYRICGVPAEPEDANVQAEHGRVKTAEVPIGIDATGLGLRWLLIGPRSDSVVTTGRAAVTGRVVDTVGVVVQNAQVSLEGASSVTTTNERGEFTLDGLPSGTQALVVRRIGFAPSRTIVDLAAGPPVRVAVRLERATPRLAPVTVTAQAEALSRVGFEDRQRRGMGKFLGPEDLERMHPTFVTNALQTMPGLRVVPAGNGRYTVQSTRDAMGGCVAYWVDGAPFREMTPGELDMSFPGGSIAAIETYQPTETPPQFSSAGQSCVTVVIWTQASVQRRR